MFLTDLNVAAAAVISKEAVKQLNELLRKLSNG